MSIRINPQHQVSKANHDSPSPAERGHAFNGILSQTQKIQRSELESFLQKLTAQGAKLSETLTLRDLKDFQDMVRSFLRSTFGLSRQMQDEPSWDSHGRPKMMARIAKIDHKLDELGKQLLNEQASSLDILSRIDEIRGMIVDLFA